MLPITFIWHRDYDTSDGTPQFSRTTVQIFNLEPCYETLYWKHKDVSVTVTETSSFEFLRTRTYIPNVKLRDSTAILTLPNGVYIRLQFKIDDTFTYRFAYIGKSSGEYDLYNEYKFSKKSLHEYVSPDWHFMTNSDCELFT